MKPSLKMFVAVLGCASILPFSLPSAQAQESVSDAQVVADESLIADNNLDEHSTYDSFSTVSENVLSYQEKSFVDKVKNKKGIHRQGDLYVVSLGEKPNPGYDIQIVGMQQSWEMFTVYVQLTKPDPNKLYSSVIHTPYLIGRAKLPKYTTLRFVDVETDRDLFR